MPDPFDPSEFDERPRSNYIGRKDVRIGLIAIGVMALILTPIYLYARRQSENHICVQNFQQMSNAVFLYMANNNDRLPPAFAETDNHEPAMFPAGNRKAPFTWISLIQGGMERRASFVCPSSQPDEIAYSLHPEELNASVPSSYGLYLPRSGWPASLIQNPDKAIIITETSNGGARDTFDPHPYKSGIDGIAIGWNDGNEKVTPESRFVTRLAFFGTKGGVFEAEGPARHDRGLNVLYASGRKGVLKSGQSRVERLGEQTTGLWSDR